MPAHSTVRYVEPNTNIGLFSATTNDIENGYELDIWHPDDGYERAPRLEDYCIALNLEVEVSSRFTQGTKDVLILQWSGDNKEGVSFMGGTKIGGYKVDGVNRSARLTSGDYLTTYYADMYVGDLIDYGTTEMIGIKSVNIEYAKSCVPIISIKFTDVRGFSLFQPTELSRTNSYDGIKGLNKDNVAQSFFQCFFKMPLPKFTIYIKGFYGKPVAYEMMCDKFETNFNSETGDYDVDTRFVGYAYSFLTDVSFDAMLAAPYSDFGGKKYWDEQVNGDNPRFFLWDKLHTKKVPMPTLYEIHSHFKNLIQNSASEMLETTLSSEELTHQEEIAKLKDIKGKYQLWYQELFNLLKDKYNKRYCFDFKTTENKDAEWYRILILTNSKTSNVDNLSEAYKQYPESFKNTNNNLFSAIEEFNNNGKNFKKLQNISKDFSKYTRVKLFNDCYINRNTRKIEFGGFRRDCNLNQTQIVNRLFYGDNGDLDSFKTKSQENSNTELTKEINEYSKGGLKDFTLNTIYGDGTDQYIDAFLIEVDYSEITRRINILTADSKKSEAQKEKEKRRKEHNRLMMDKMNWYPSVENFMKVVMAHVETYMMMMYDIKDACENRTPKDMGVTVGFNGDARDVNETSKTLPPFPRITKKEIGDDGLEKVVDAWVGDYNDGKRFIEADFINGLFNAVEYLQELVKKDNENLNNSESVENAEQPILKHPLTSYDFYLTKNPYGSENDISNNPNAFAGKVAMRMFNILSLNNFKKEYGDKWSFSRTEFLEKLGKIEAENFNYCVSITNKTMLQMLGVEGGEGTITPDSIIKCVKYGIPIGGNEDIPWSAKNEPLFSDTFWLDLYKTSYSNELVSKIYPIQDVSFKELNSTLIKFNKGVNSFDINNDNIMVSWIDAKSNAERILKSNNSSCFGNLYISEDYKKISNILDGACSSPSNSYKEVYDLIHDSSVFNGEEYKKMVYPLGVFRPRRGISSPKEPYISTTLPLNSLDLFIKPNKDGSVLTRVIETAQSSNINYSFDSTKLDDFSNEVENKSITSWFFTECRGYSYKNGNYEMALNKSFFAQKDYLKDIEDIKWGYGNVVDKRIGFFLMGLEAIDYDIVAKELGNNKTFAYLPKLAVLQIGAALASLQDIKAELKGASVLTPFIRLPRTFGSILNYLNRINYTTRLAYIKYFKDWVLKYSSEINTVLFRQNNNNVSVVYKVGEGLTRTLFKEDSDFSQGLANNLMIPVIVSKGNVNHYRAVSKNGLEFSDYSATSFLNGFLSRLRELYGVSGTSGSDAVKLAAEPNKTTEDMKKELYRYMKLVYEKWIPSMSRDEWKFETFFDKSAEERIRNNGAGGHLFHFIDSFYNKIGDKLLINPMGLSQIIDSALAANNTNTMLLGFIADVLSKNRTMLLCLQNFQDLSHPASMDMMFRPIPYNSIRDVNKHPDFVILYPYEPSKYLNVENGEFNNDAFMLNDEFETPLAIRSRGKNDEDFYYIPAFGVSYGKQYQSYFKKVNVGMQNPIATQQAIMAKHAILRRSQDGNSQSTVAQDMYDIYTTQSYTCKVEMMGCAWVQPLMYFVLTNVPMFKGSYLIFKVTHQITPGNMTTIFEGTRMANVSNRLVDEIFTDDDFGMGVEESYNDNRRNSLANVDNDCPYKVYPLFESDNITLNGNQLEKGSQIMSILMRKGLNKVGAAGVVGNIFQECKFDHTDAVVDSDGYIAGGICGWNDRYGNLTHLSTYPNKCDISKYGQAPVVRKYGSNKNNISSAKEMLKEKGLGTQIDFLMATLDKPKNPQVTIAKLNACSTPEQAAEMFRAAYERGTSGERNSFARKFYEGYKEGSNVPKISEKIKPNNSDIYNAFLNAVQKSLASTNCNVSIVKDDTYNVSNSMRIVRKDRGTEKMDLVFDIILNGYYEYVQTLSWGIKGNDYTVKPSYIDVTVSQNVKPNERFVQVSNISGKWYEINKITFGNDSSGVNQSLLKSLYKRYKADTKYKKEIPQFVNFDIFKEIQVKDCDTLMTDGNLQYPSEISPSDEGTIDGWDVGKACQYLIAHSAGESKHKCALYVENAIAAGGGPLKNKMSCGSEGNYATNLRYNGILERNNFVMIDKGTVPPHGDTRIKLQSGDVAIIGSDAQIHGGKFHACMYCSKGWISDFRQNHMNPYSTSWPYAIYRYKNKKKA